jgi:hypothetical protein
VNKMPQCNKCGSRGAFLKTYSVKCDLNCDTPHLFNESIMDADSNYLKCCNGGTYCEKCFNEIKLQPINISFFEEQIFKDIYLKTYLFKSKQQKEIEGFNAWLNNCNQYCLDSEVLKLCSKECLEKIFHGFSMKYFPPMRDQRVNYRINLSTKLIHFETPNGKQYDYILFTKFREIFSKQDGEQFFNEMWKKEHKYILMREAIRTPSVLELFDECFPQHPIVKERLDREKKEEQQRRNQIEMENDMSSAVNAEQNSQFDLAISLHKKLGSEEDVKRILLKKIEVLKDSFKFEEAALIFEELNMHDEAGKLRKEMLEYEITTRKMKIGKIDESIHITDSVVNRTNITQKSNYSCFSICPYCGKELNLQKSPKFCPYCREQIQK